MRTSAKKHKELRRVRKPNNIPVYRAKQHEITKYNGDGSLNQDYIKLQDLKKLVNNVSP